MQQNFFIDHKQKYTSFAIVAIFIIFITYVVYKSEALGRPTADENFLASGRRCPSDRVRAKLPANHPCYQTEEQARNAEQARILIPPQQSQAPEPVAVAESQPEQESTATTTPDVAPAEDTPTAVEATTTIDTAIEESPDQPTELSE